ncbi:hypothetical protein T01_7653 [Trichinella spiralis]|uniref:Uncharacterized protein n=1 Tax=Trichinella spiralis TaxID=6334 RepID=A0A0V1BRP8_TRISP|nr:hypothetical protein T01_7653 [Trichinella spiralis]
MKSKITFYCQKNKYNIVKKCFKLNYKSYNQLDDKIMLCSVMKIDDCLLYGCGQKYVTVRLYH